MKVRLTIDMENSAFEGENAGPELARILRKAADSAANAGDLVGFDGMNLRDVNGNTVGELEVWS